MNFHAIFQMDNHFSFIRHLACNHVNVHNFKKLLWWPSTRLPNPYDLTVPNKMNI